MDDIRIEDARAIYNRTLCNVNGRPSFVKEIDYAGNAGVLDLMTKKTAIVKFNRKSFGAPRARIGYVNHRNNAFYVSRLPVRRYQVGLSVQNCKVQAIPHISMDAYRKGLIDVKSFSISAIAYAINKDYPSFGEAYERAKESKGCWAFDTQFAVNYEGKIFYKLIHVGKVGPKAKTTRSIKFFEDKTYLAILLKDQDYAKTAKPIGV